MPVYAFQLSSHLAGRAVSVSPAGSDSVVASGTLDGSASFSVSLPVGDYVAVAGSGQYAYRAAGTVDQGDTDRLAESALSSAFATAGQVRSKVKTDGTDQSATLQGEINALVSAGGGTLLLPSGTIRVDGQITMPYTTDGTGAPVMGSVAIVGTGSWATGRGSGVVMDPSSGGTMLDMRYAGSGAAMLLSVGFGRLTLTGITFMDKGTSSVPFVKVTNTTLIATDNAFIGNPSKSALTCDQDAIVLGGTNVPAGGDFDTSDNGPFQGYGTVVERNWFNRIRRGVFGQVYANGTIVRANTFWQKCGSNLAGGAGIEFNPGSAAGSSVFGNVIEGNLFEVGGYVYGIKLDYAQGNSLIGNNFYDQSATTQAYIRFNSVNAKANYVLMGYGSTIVQHISEQTAGVNTWTSMLYSVPSQVVSKQEFSYGIRTKAAYTFGAGNAEVTLGMAANAPGIYTGSGSPEGVITARLGSLYLRVGGGTATSLYVKEGGDNANTGWVAK